jgi:hypothetical protein
LVDGTSDGPIAATQVLDLQGRVVAQSRDLGGVWADDSRHLCNVRPHHENQSPFDGPADLVVSDPGHRSQVIAITFRYHPHGGPVVLRCSITDDQAIIGDRFFGGVAGVLAIKLSTGAVTKPSWVPDQSASVVAISGNGRYVLELSHEAGPGGRVIDTRSGRIVGHVDGQPTDISWNGHLVTAVVNGLDLGVIDWRTGRVVWRSANRSPDTIGILTGAQVAARPFSDDLALAVSGIPGQPLQQASLWLVTNARPPRKLASSLVGGVI